MWLPLRRFGFLPFLAVWTIQAPMIYFPLVAAGWMASRSLAVHLFPLALGAWALWVILSAHGSTGGAETAA